MRSLNEVKGIGLKTIEKLNLIGIFSLDDLINSLPGSYLDFSCVTTDLADTPSGAFCVLEVTIALVKPPVRRGRLSLTRLSAVCGGEKLNLVWFNQPYISKVIKAGDELVIFGKLTEKRELHNPGFEKKSDESRFEGIQPIYRTKGVFTQRGFHNLVNEGLSVAEIESVISKEIEEKLSLGDLKTAYNLAHNPKTIEDKSAKERIILEGLVKRLAAFRVVREKANINRRTNNYESFDLSKYCENLPFSLSLSQSEALEKIVETLRSPKKLNAVLCGDVGSGKTAVALALAYLAIKNGYQVALMAPTELLGCQHVKTVERLFKGLNISCRMLVGRQKKSEREEILDGIRKGEIDLVVGTHAIIGKATEFKRLGVIILDEQHRFGVGQRTALLDKGFDSDVLMLSATPIPRSMQLALFGDLDFYSIEKRMFGNIKTAIVYPEKREKMFEYIAEECKKGKQAYIVCPTIEDSEGIETESVKELFKELKTDFFASIPIGLLHGKMGTEKQEVLDLFAEGKLSALVSTTVVEVGIDVQNASIIAVMDAERFGLATLHQLRGRVGRDGGRAYCFLYTKELSNERLTYMTETEDGFLLAEKDFDMRGGGEIFGLAQSGKDNIVGLTAKSLKRARKIVDMLDLKEAEPLLLDEIKKFSLKSVSLT